MSVLSRMDKKSRSVKKRWLLSSSLLSVPLMLIPFSDGLHAMPGDGTVVAGQANINTVTPTHMTVTQGSNTAIINWNGFSIGNGETVQFIQPGQSSLAINRVLGDDPSAIFGSLIANGQIMLINPNGVLFGPNSRVDVGGLIATTIDIDDEKILSGDFTFDKPGNPAAAIVNQGTITAADGGLVAFVAPGVSNSGVIQARLGRVTMAGANKFSVDLYGDGLVSIPVTEELANAIYDAQGNPLSATVSNSGTIKADGGQVVLTARTAKSLVDDTVNMSGIIEAKSVHMKDGVIVLDGGAGTTRVSGTINASGKQAGEKGGTVKITGDQVAIDNGARIDASGDVGGGTIHIGGEYQGGGTLARSKETTVAADTVIDASAITNGNGGEVVVWSDGKTKFSGTVKSRGGAEGGNGGRVETSGKETLAVTESARVDAAAPVGEGGHWLLDPRDVYLRAGVGDDVSGGGPYNPTIDDASVNIATINMALASGVSVTITTNDVTGIQPGNLTLVDAMNLSPTGGATLTLVANNNIVLNNSISSTGTLNLVLTAAGNVTQSIGTVNTGGGNLTINAADILLSGGGFNAGAGSITINNSVGGTIALGSGVGTMSLSSAELALMSANLLKIGNAASGAITIGADITPAATSFHLQTGGGITGTAGGIIATNLALQAGGTINMTDASTNVTNVAVSAAGQSVTFADANAVNIGSVNGVIGATAATLNVNAGGAVTDSAAIAATTLAVTAGGAVALDTATNNVTNVNINAGANTIAFTDTDGFNITGLTGTAITLIGGGAITDSGTITGTTLSVTNTGTVTLDSAANNVNAININAGANAITYTDSNALDIAGLIGSTVTINSGALSDSGTITATTLNITATGAVTLDSAANDVTNLSVSAAGHNVNFADASGLNLAGITAANFTLTAAGAVTDSAATVVGDLDITTTGAVTLDFATNNAATIDINAGANAITFVDTNGVIIDELTGSSATITAGGTITDDGVINAATLNLTATGAVTIDNLANNINVLSVSAAGQTIIYNDANGVDLGNITGTTLTLNAGGAITDSGNIVVTNLNLTAAGNVTLNSAGNNAAAININAGANSVTYVDTNGFDIAGLIASSATLTGGGTITDSAGMQIGTMNVTSTGTITLDHAANDFDNLTISNAGQTTTIVDADGINLAGVTAGTFTLTAGGAVTDSAATVATNLNVTAPGAVTLDFATNNVTNLMISAAGQAVIYRDVDGFNLAGILANSLAITANGAVTDSVAMQIADLTINNTGGPTTIDEAANDFDNIVVSAGGQTVGIRDADGINLGGITAGTMTINAGGAVTDSAGTVAGTLNVTATGAVTLDHAANDVTNLSVAAGANDIVFNDASGLNLAGITGNNFVLTAAGAVTDTGATIVNDLDITATGAVTLDSVTNNAATIDINAGANAITFVDTNGVIIDGLTGTVANITAGGTITDNGIINAATLNLTATGAVTIDNLANNINVLSVSAAGQTIIYNDANGVDLAGITGNTLTLNAGGAVSDSGNIVVTNLNVTAGGNVILNSAGNNAAAININAGANSVTYVDTNGFDIAGLIASSATLTGGGVITDSVATQVATMNVTSTGAITLDEVLNDYDNLTISAAGQTVIITDVDALNIAGATAGTLTLTTGGALTDSGNIIATNLTITNTVAATTLDQIGNDVDNLVITAGAQAVTFRDTDSLTLNGITAGTLALQVGGVLQDTAATVIAGTTTITAGANAVTLDFATNNFNDVTIVSAGAATLFDTDAITLNASSMTGALTVNANNGITVAGNVTAAGVTMNSDLDTNGTGDLTVNGGVTLNSNNAAMTLTANDLILNGSTTSGTNTTNVIVSDNGTIDIGNGGTGAMNISAAEIAAMGGNIVKIGNASSGAITISSDVTPGATSLHLQSGSTITGTAGGIVVTNLALQAGGTINFTDTTTNVSTIAMSAPAQNVTFVDANGFNIGTVNGVVGISGGTINLTGNGAITDNAATIGTNLTINNTGGLTTLDFATNDVDNLTVVGTGQGVTFRDADDINLAGIDATSLTLQAGGAVTDSVAMQIGTVSVTSTGSITLNEATNDFNNLTISNAGQTTIITDVNAINLAGITAGTFTLTAGGAVTDSAASVVTNLNITATGAVTLDVATNNATNLMVSAAGQVITYRDTNGVNLAGITGTTFNLQAAGVVTDSAATVVTNLGITNTAAVTLDFATNDVDTIAIAAGANNITFVDVDGIDIGTVGPYNGLTGGTILVTAGGAVTQSQAISGANLGVTATGPVTLTHASNAVTGLGISAAGQAAAYTDSNGIDIANVSGVDGINVGSLDLIVGGALTDTAVTIVSGHTNITAGTNAITLNTATNNFNTLDIISAGAITLVDMNSITFTNIDSSVGVVGITAGGSITLSGNSDTNDVTTFTTGTTGTFTVDPGMAITTSNDNVTISAGDLVLTGTINSGSGTTAIEAIGTRTIDIGSGGGGQFNVSQAELNAITANVIRVGGAASGAITISSDISAAGSDTLHLQSASTITGTAGGIIEDNLAITAGGAVNITDASTNVNNLAISTTNQNVTFRDADAINFGNVSTLTGTALGTGVLEVTAGGAVTDAHNMTGGGLAVTSTGAITLNNNNNFNNVAFSAAGQAVTYNDVNAINIAGVGTVTGITAGSLTLTATTGGITDAADTVVSGHTTLAGGTGVITLDRATNDFNTVTINSGTATTVRDANDLTISASTTSGATTFQADQDIIVNGAITTGVSNAAVTLTGNDLIINGGGSVNSGSGTTTFQAGGTNRSVDIGGAGANYNVSQAEINAVTAGNLRIASTTGTAGVTLSNATLTASGTTGLHLQGGNNGVNTSGGAITIQNLALQATGTGVIDATNAANDVDNLAITRTGAGITNFVDVDGVNIGTVNGVVGLTGTNIGITAAGITDSSLSTVTNFAFNSTGAVVLDAANNFGTIAGTAAGQSVTINDANALILGQVNVGTVYNGITAENLNITVGGALTDTQASTITNNTVITAGANNVTLDHANNDFNNVVVNSGHFVQIYDVNDITIGTSSFSDVLWAHANNDVTVSGDVTATLGFSFVADLDNNGSGVFTVNTGQTVTAATGSINIRAYDIVLDGNLNSVMSNVNISPIYGQTVGIGDTPQDMSISKAELSRITAGQNLVIGSTTTGDFVVDNVSAADLANVAGNLNLNARGNAANIRFINNPSSFKTIFATADDSIFVEQNLSSTVGQISLTADYDGAPDPEGDQVYVSAGVNITAAADAIFESATGITIGTNVTVLGPLVINADTDNDGIGSLTILGGITILTNNNDLSMTAADYLINGIINAGTGRVSIETTAGRTIGVGDAAGQAQISKLELQRITAGQLYIGGTNTGNIRIDNVNTTDLAGIAGLVTFAALFNGAGVFFDNADTQFANAMTANAENGVTFDANVTAGGLVTIDSDINNDGDGDTAITATHTLNSAGNNIDITANDATIAGSINAGAGTTTILVSDNGTVGLGGAGGNMNLSAAELANITSNTLRIGDAAGGAITVSADATLGGVGTLHLRSGSTMTGTAGGLIVNNLAMSAGGAVNFTDISSDVNNLAITTTTGSINFYDTDGLNITTVAGVNGLSTGAGNITVRATDMNIAQAVNAGAGTVTLEGGAGGTIGIGGAGGMLNLTNAELNQITAATLHIGTAAAGAITVSADTTPAGVNRLELQTGGTVTGTAGGIVVNDLSIAAGGAVNFTDTTTDVNTLSVAAAGQAITFFDADDISVALTGATANISANNGITVTADFAGNGVSTFNADADNNGTGTFTTNAGVDISTTNNALNITARDMVLNGTGTLSSGSGITTILVSNGGTISLGGAGGNMALTDAELDTITAGTLRIGDATAGAITIAGDISPGGTTTLHLHTGSSITGTAGGIIETNLAMTAGGTINITDTSSDVTTIAIAAPAQNVTFRDANGINIGTVDGVVGVNSGNFTLIAGGAVTDTNAITTGTLDITSTGAVTLDAAGTDVDTFAVNAAGQTVAITDVDGINLGNATAGTLTVNATGAITDSGNVVVGTLNATTSTGGIVLNSAGNNATNINLNATGQTVTFVDTNGFNINGLTGQAITLTAGGAVTDSGTITADTLNITGTGSITLDSAANDVNDLTVSAAGQTVAFTDADGINLAGITAGSFTLNAGGAVTDSAAVTAGAFSVTATGPITFDFATSDVDTLYMSAAGQTVAFTDADGFDITGLNATTANLTAGGNVTDSGTITATNFNITGTGSITLNSAANDVDNLNVSAAGQTVTFVDVDGINLAGLIAGTANVQAGGAVTDSAAITAGTFNLTATGPVTLDFATTDVDNLGISAGGQTVAFTDADGFNITGLTAASATLNAGNAVTDSGAIIAGTLNLTTVTGGAILDNATNDVDNLMISAAGQTASFVDADGINLAGITAQTFTLNAGGGVTDSAAVTADTFNVTTTAGGITLDMVTSDVNDLNLSAVGQVASFTDADGVNLTGLNAGTFTLTANGAVTDSGTLTAGTLNVTTPTGGVVLNSAANDVDTLNINAAGQTITFVDADGFDISGLNGNAVTLTAGGAVTDSGTIIANTLNITGTGAITLNSAANDVNDLIVSAAGQAVTFVDADGINLAGINAGSLTLNAGNAVTDSAAITAGTLTITTAAGGVALDHAASDVDNLAITAAAQTVSFSDTDGLNINALTAGTATINTGGALTDSGTIAVGTLTVTTASGGMVLDTVTNDVDVLTVNATGQTASFRDADGIDLAGVTASTFTLQTGGAVTDSGTITAGTLNVTSTGAVTLNTAANDVDNLNVSAAGQAVTFIDADGINLTGINAGSLALTTGGGITDSGAVVVSGATTLTAGTGNDITLDFATNNFNTVAVVTGNNVTLRDTNAITLNASTVSGGLDVRANNGLTIAGNVTSNGTTVLNADNDNNSSGALTVNGGATLNTTNNTLTATARDLTLTGALNSGTAITTLLVSNGGTISLGGGGGNMSITNPELDAITASILRIGDNTAGNITVVADIAPANTNTLHLRTGGSITGTAGGITETNLAMSAGTGINISDTTTNIGTLAATTTTGSINIDDSGTLIVGIVDGVTGLSAAAGNITLQATDMDIQQAINSGAGIVTLLGDAAGTISLGGAGGALALTNAELNAITAGTLRIGDASAGAITVAADIAPAGTNTLHLRTGSSITGTAGGITETNVALTAGTGINITDTTTDIGTLAATSTAGAVTVVDTGMLTIATVDSITGITATGGNLNLTAGDYTITQAINNGANITTLLGVAGNTISLGGAGGAMALTNPELNLITANILRIGDAAAGAITIVSDIAPAGTSTLHLRTGSTITGTAGGITETNLAMSAGGTINITDATTDVDTLAIAAPGQAVTFTDSDNVTFGTVDGVSGITASSFTLTTGGAVVDSGPIIMDTLNIIANGNVTLTNVLNDVNNLSITATGFDATFVDADDINLTGISANNFTLTAGGAVTDSGTITAGTLSVTTPGAVTLNTATNDVDNLAINAGGQPIIFVDADGFNINALTGGNTTLTAGNTVTQSGAITATTLSLTTTAGGFTLNHAGNDVDDLIISSAAQTGSFRDADGVNLVGVNAGSFTLNAGGAVTDSGAITAGTLNVTSSGGSVTLDNATNDVDILAINAGANSAAFTDIDGVDLAGITASGFTLNAGGAVTDSGPVVAGTLNILAGGAVTLDNAANDADDLSISAGANPITFVDVDGLNITNLTGSGATLTTGGALTQSGGITVGALSINSGGGVTLNTGSNDVDSLSVAAPGQAVAFTDMDDIALNGITAASFALNANGNVTDIAASTISGATTIGTGAGSDVILDAANDFGSIAISLAHDAVINDINAVSLGTSNLAGTLTVTAASGITQTGNITAAGATTLDADLDNNGTGDYTINGGQTLNVTGANPLTIIANDVALNGNITNAGGTTTILASDNGTISLGGAGGDMALGTLEMANIIADTLRIGDAAGGAISVVGNVAPAGVNNLHLRSGGAVTGTAGGVTVANLAITAGGTVDMSNPTHNVTNIAIAAPGQTVSFRDANAANITTVDGVTGITGTSVTLQTGGALSGDTVITAPTLNIISGGAVSLATATNNVTDLSVAAPGQTVSFLDAGGINLAGVTANTFNLTTSGAVTDSGTLAVTGTTTIDAGAGNDITLDTAANDFGTVAIASGRHVTLRDTNGITVGASTISGILDVAANNGVTIDGAVTTAGATVIDADLDNNGSGVFTVNGGASLNTANNTLTVTADDFAINGTVNSGAAGTALAASTPNATWGLGNAAGDVSLSGAELQNITAASLTLGGADAGTMTVDGVSGAHSANINHMILNALGNNSQVRFINNASTFNGITATADAGIDALVNITASNGDMNFNGDADNADDAASDAITYGPGVLLNAAGNINLSATTGGGIMTGPLTLLSSNGNIVIDDLDGAQNLNATATNGDITITGSIGGTTPLNNVVLTGLNTTGDIHAQNLTLDMDSAILTGTIAGQTGEDAAALIVLSQLLPGPYTMNGFLIEGYIPPPPPPPVNDQFDPSTMMPPMQVPWRSSEGRIQTMGDLMYQDPLRTPYIPDLFALDDTFFTYTRDLMLSIYEGSVTDLRLLRIISDIDTDIDNDGEDDEEEEDDEVGLLVVPPSVEALVAHR